MLVESKRSNVETARAAANEAPPVAKILAVDDNEANLIALRAILSDLGQPVVCAHSGEEALRLLLEHEFAIILLDVRMPGMDGYETASFIRSRDRTSRVPIIFLSAVDKEERHLFRGYAAGAVDYVFKPIEPMVLRAKVSVFIDLHAKTQEILQKAEQERQLLEENLRVRAQQLETAEALRRSLAQQSLVIDSLPMALFVASAKDGYQSRRFVGGNLAALLDIPETEVQDAQDHWMERIHVSDRDRMESAFSELDTIGSVSNEYRFECKEGNQRWFLERVSLRKDSDETSREIVGFLFDISKRKRMEGQLAHAQKMEAIGQMTGSIAHDFNNMLGVIIGSLDRTLVKEELSPKLRQRLDLAMQAAVSCSELIKRLLGFGRRETLNPRTIRLKEEFERLTPIFERVLVNTITLEIKCAADLWPVYLDASQLEAAIVNMTINARDAMPKGGQLTISARNIVHADLPPCLSALQPGDFVEVTVADTGSGMSKAVQERALEPFFTTKGPGKGTGLGLSSIDDFMRQSGGGLDIESEPGKGTKIRLYMQKAH